MPEIQDHVTIAPHKGLQPLNLPEIWQYRNLILKLVKRDLSIQYKNTGLGLVWIIVEPLALALILTFVLNIFTRFANNTGIPYSLLVLSGIIPWNFFSRGLTSACESILANFSIFSKVYLPRLIIPVIPNIAGLVNYFVLSLLFIIISLFFGIAPTERLLYLPLLVILLFLLTSGFSFWFAALNVQFRDVGKLLPVILQIGFYATPILYELSFIPEKYRGLMILNPLVGIINFTRWIYLNSGQFPSTELLITTAFALITMVSGMVVFRQFEDKFVDIS